MVNGRIEQALAALAQGDTAGGLAIVVEAATRALQRGDLAAMEALLARALVVSPRQPALLALRAGLSRLRGNDPAALAAALAALESDPGNTAAAALAVELLADRGACSRAVEIAEACLARVPDAPHVRRTLSQALLFLGRAPEALRAARTAADTLGGNSAALSTACITSLYDDTQPPAAVAELHRACGDRMRAVPAPPLDATPAASGRRVRVGFASADLRAHPVGYFIEPLLTHLDRLAYEVFCYARVGAPDALTARLRALPLHWRDTAALDDAQALALMRADRLDMLVDLSGHTHGGRPAVLVARAAPVQLLYLGYPYSSGMPNVDFVLGDDAVLPPGCEPHYREIPLRLPHGFLCLAPPPDAPEVDTTPRAADAPFTFASFNNLAKLSDATVALWARVLAAVPDARLALCALALSDPGARTSTLERFARHGVAARHVVLLPPRAPLAQFLRYYDRVDLALDPLPFNGGTTTVQALWQGVATITLPGTLLQQRMGLSILRAAGLEDQFVAHDESHYVELARGWAARRGELAAMRAGMRERLLGTTLFDAARFTRGFEATLRHALAISGS